MVDTRASMSWWILELTCHSGYFRFDFSRNNSETRRTEEGA